MKVLVTGGAGFIGSALVRLLAGELGVAVVNVDALTYAGHVRSVASVADRPGYRFVRADIRDGPRMAALLAEEAPDAIVNLAAETHVDRSIDGPAVFVETNVLGTCTLLDAALGYWRGQPAPARERFRFHQVSTDEVFGALGPEGRFDETSPYRPNSPYAASKAGADHLVRAWGRTYGLPVLVTHATNNYGPHQFPEKLIPLAILNALEGQPLPIYGDGRQVRDWLHVEDHARALWQVLSRAPAGAVYAVGANAQRSNLDVVTAIADLVDRRRPDGAPRRRLIRHVADRPAHDVRYAVDAARLTADLGWTPGESFESGLARTVDWYLDNPDWWQPIRARRYAGERLGAPAGGAAGAAQAETAAGRRP